MATHVMRQRSNAYAANVHRRGNVKQSSDVESEKKRKHPVAPILVALLVLVLLGHEFFAILGRIL